MSKLENTKKNFIALVCATILSKCIGFGREVISADHFGLSENFDIYLAIFMIPSMITSILLYAIPNIIIPKLKLNKEVKEDEFYHYFSSHFFWPYVLLIVGILILYNIFLQNYIDFLKISEDKFSMACLIGRYLSIYILFESFFTILMVLYNAREKFVFPAFLHLLLQSSVIVSLFLFAEKNGVIAIVWGLAVGSFAEFFIFVARLNRQKILKYFPFKLAYTENLFVSGIIILMIEIIGQFYAFADRIYLARLPEGYITSLYYANILKELPFVIFGITLGSVLLPKMSKKFQDKDYEGLKQIMKKVLFRLFIGALFIVFLFCMGGTTLVQLIFERGNFTSNDTLLTSEILIYYAIGLPFIFMHFLLVKFYYSLKLEKIVFITTFISILVKIILNYYFVSIQFYKGLALATSLVFVVNTLLLFLHYLLKIDIYFDKQKID